MTKAIVCLLCVDVRMLRPEGPVSCFCGNVRGRWLDSGAGTCRIEANDLSGAALMGLNNGFFGPGLLRIKTATGSSFDAHTNAWWRDLHQRANVAPGYYFDRSIRDCWAILMGPKDAVSGVTWEEVATLVPRPT